MLWEPYRALAPYEEGQGALIERARAYLKIQDGCDRHCTYCIIPAARGPIRSRSLEALRAETQSAAKAGHAEIVLTGIRLASYGRERGLTLADALKAAAETDVQRIRLGSLDPDEISQDPIDACAAEEKFCRQFHLSLQSGCDKTLHRMARRYTTAQFADTVARIRAAMPDAVFTTDVMCGFVGETEEDHRTSLAFCRKHRLLQAACVPLFQAGGHGCGAYAGASAAGGKAAEGCGNGALGRRLEQRYLQQIVGTEQEVVLETQQKDGFLGHTRGYAPVLVRGEGWPCSRSGAFSSKKRIKICAKGLQSKRLDATIKTKKESKEQKRNQ